MNNAKPLAERVRPHDLNTYFGQQHLLHEQSSFKKMLTLGMAHSMILWGPPGVGKTTLARIIGHTLHLPFYQLSAISAGVAEVRKVIDEAKKLGKVLLFLDEIHRFNKSQQDALLGAVENGSILLIGATTENPSFEVNNALLSRCQVYILHELSAEDLRTIVHHAISTDELMQRKKIILKEEEALFLFSGGDARKLLNLLELLYIEGGEEIVITNALVKQVFQKHVHHYDKSGESHYNIISAFIKSIRGSDPNAAIYWLARMLEGGEDIKFIARRMVISAAEDIGMANPNALLMANQTFQAVQYIGMPEARIILSECAIFLASSAKSNSAYIAIDDAIELVKKTGNLPVPIHLRNAPTKLMKELNYGKEYEYAHLYEQNFVMQEYLPENISGANFYVPGNNTRELELKQFLNKRWKGKYGY